MQQQPQEPTAATVSVSVTTPELGVNTRVFGDGTTAKTLHYAVYNAKVDAAGDTVLTYLPDLTVEDHEFELSTTVDLQLVTGNTYKVIFWADSDDAPYTIHWTDATTGAANASVSVDYTDVTSNNEAYDAFFNWMTIVVNASKTESIKLYRPFGQLNIGTNDMKKALSAGYELKETQVTVATYNTLDLWTKEVSGEETVEFAWATFPDSTKETFPVKVATGELPYYYLAMNYLLLPTDKKLVDVTFDYTDLQDNKQRTFSAVPVRRNWRTNIYGQLLTSDIDVNVEIVPLFEDQAVNPDSIYNIEVWDGHSLTKPARDEDGNVVIYHGDELAYFANMINGGGQSNAANAPATRGEEDTFDYYTATIKLMNNIDLGGENWTPINGVKYINSKGQEALKCFTGTFDGNGHTISNLYVRTEGRASAGLFASARNIKNLTVKDADVAGHYKTAVIAGDGLCARIENCHVENAVVLSTPYEKDDANNVGGIVGYLCSDGEPVGPNAWVKNSTVKNAEITAYRKVGGIAGIANGPAIITGCLVENVIVTADQSAEYKEVKPTEAGAIVGSIHADATVENNTEGEGVEVIVKGIRTEELNSLVAVEGAVVNLGAGTYTFPGGEIAEGVTINCEEGVVFEGQSNLNINGATVIGGTFSNEAGTAVRSTINGTFKGCTFTGSNAFRYCYAGETTVFEDCVFDGAVYGVHFDGGAHDATFRRCTFSGFNAFGSALTLLTLEDCVFKSTGKSSYNGANLWGTTNIIRTKFIFDGAASTEWIGLNAAQSGKVITFTDCEVEGTQQPIFAFFANWEDGNEVVVDGVTYTNKNGNVANTDGNLMVFDAKGLAQAIADKAETIVLAPGTYEGNFTIESGLIKSMDSNNKAIVKGRIELINPNVTFQNIKFDYNDASKAEFSSAIKGNPKGHPAIVGVYGGITSIATFENCEFNFKSGYSAAKAPGAISHYGDVKLTLNGCVLDGDGNPIYAKTNVEMTGCTVKMYGNNAVLSLNYGEKGHSVIFKNNTLENKSTNGAKMYVMQFLSTNGKNYKNMYFDVQGNTGVDVTYAAGSSYTFDGVTYAEGSEQL